MDNVEQFKVVFPILKLKNDGDISIKQQFLKNAEELKELWEALVLGRNNNALEEAFDTIQSVLGYLLMEYTEKELQEYSKKHYEKLKERRWGLLGRAEMTIEKNKEYEISTNKKEIKEAEGEELPFTS